MKNIQVMSTLATSSVILPHDLLFAQMDVALRGGLVHPADGAWGQSLASWRVMESSALGERPMQG